MTDEISSLQQAEANQEWDTIWEVIFSIFTPVQDDTGTTEDRWVQDSLTVRAGCDAAVAIARVKEYIYSEEYGVAKVNDFHLMSVKALAEAEI